jgi:hypothetical protein
LATQRQHCAPLLLTTDGAIPLESLGLRGGKDAVSESDIQAVIQSHPACLPIAEIDQMFIGAVPICRELETNAGKIDNFMVTPSGLPVLVECKLWRNPEARREVVGQILDYAKELSRWSSSDLQREVSRNLKQRGNALLERVREVAPETDESQFNDSLTANLRRGRFLLLIVGDGIREGVEAIAEYLQAHAGLHFSLGLVEMPIFALPSGERLVVPRILARANIITRTVIETPPGYNLEDDGSSYDESGVDPDREAYAQAAQDFWKDFLKVLKLDDPEQRVPNPARQGSLRFMLPVKDGSCWIGVYRNLSKKEVGVQLQSTAGTAGDFAREAVVEDWDAIKTRLGGTAKQIVENGRVLIRDCRTFSSFDDAQERTKAFAWLSERVNTFVSILRPIVRSAAADFEGREEG